MKYILAWYCIVAGIFSLGLSVFIFWQRTTPQRLTFDIDSSFSSFSRVSDNTAVSPLSLPTYLVIEDLGISLPIYPAAIQNGKWETSNKGVSHLSSSSIPGEVGNSILYGHNWSNLLGKLTKAKQQQNIKIWFSDGSMKIFVIERIAVVTPDQTHVLRSTSVSKLITLYTCTGFLDRKRFVVSAVLREG